MALTRRLLKGMGLTDEQVDTIIEAHTDTVDGLKADVATYKADAEKLPKVQKELDTLKAAGDGGWQEKYEKVKKDFDTYKTEQTKKESHVAKEKAYRALLQEAGVSEKRLESVLKVSDVDSVELDDKGAIKGADKLTESIKSEWADFITTTETRGASTSNPPANNGVAKTKEQIMGIKDTAERQRAIAQNLTLFQKTNE